MKNIKIALIAGFFSLVLVGLFIFLKLSYAERKITVSTQLIESFSSLMSPAQAEEILKGSNYTIMVIENSSLKEGDKRPKFSILSWKVDNYEHLGIKGGLTLTFFNEQLMSTRFYPNDYLAYIKILSEKYRFDLKAGITSTVPPKTNLKYNQDLDGNFFIEWQDKELQDQVDEWVKNYS